MADPFILFTVAATIVTALIVISVLTLKYHSLKATLAAHSAAAAHSAELQAQQRQAEAELQAQMEAQRQAERQFEMELQTQVERQRQAEMEVQIQTRLEPLYQAIHQKEVGLMEYRDALMQQDQLRLQELQQLRQNDMHSALSQAQAQLQQWRERDLETISAQLKTLALQEARVELDEWKAAQEQKIRADAVSRSQSVFMGKITEQFTPYLPDFSFNPKDARFFGSPVDFLVFDGMDEGDIRQIVFIEIKTGKSSLTTRERQIRDALHAGHVRWMELRTNLLNQDNSVDATHLTAA